MSVSDEFFGRFTNVSSTRQTVRYPGRRPPPEFRTSTTETSAAATPLRAISKKRPSPPGLFIRRRRRRREHARDLRAAADTMRRVTEAGYWLDSTRRGARSI